MKKITCLFVVLFSLVLTACSLFDDEKATLEKRYEELSDLNDKLQEKRTEVLDLHQRFIDDVEALKNEIASIINSNQGMTYGEALSNSRISYNLKLLQQKNAYIDKLVDFQSRLLHGSEEVLFLTRKTESDLAIVKVVDEKELASLIEKIDKVVKDYLPYADKLEINIDSASLVPPENILREIAQNRANYEQSRMIIKEERYSNDYRIIELIKKGKMDIDWYENSINNCVSVISTEVNIYSLIYSNLQLEMKAEKIFFLKPYVIIGVIFNFYDNFLKLPECYLLDKNGKKYELEKIIWEEDYSPKKFYQGNPTIKGSKGQKKKVLFVFPFGYPENFDSGVLYLDGEEMEFSKKDLNQVSEP